MRNLRKLTTCVLVVVLSGLLGIAGAFAQSGPARVVSVDAPEMCLRVRSGPGASYPVVGCAAMGARLVLTGVWSNNNWAEITSPVPGWVSGLQIRMLVVAAPPPPPVAAYNVTAPAVTYYYGPSYGYGGPYWRRYYRGYGPYYHRGYAPYYHGYRGRWHHRPAGVAVGVGPRGGVAVRAGGVGVRVGPRGGVGVRVR